MPIDKLLRMLAKKPSARLMWIISKNSNSPIFSGIASEWSSGRVAYLHWCLFYDNVYDSYDRPPDRIIDDDEELDTWLDYKRKEAEMKHEKDYSGTGFGGRGISAYDADEVYEMDEDYY